MKAKNIKMVEHEQEDKRQFARFGNNFNGDHKSPLLLVTVPALAEGPLQPEVFSAGGFRLKLAKPPEIGTEVDCTIKIFDITLTGLKGRIAWIADDANSNSLCFAGLSIQISDGERDVLSSLLTAILTGNFLSN